MRITEWDGSDRRALNGCYEAALAAYRADDPCGPPPGPDWIRMLMTQVPGGDRRQAWFAADDNAGILGWYALRLPGRENRHLGLLELWVHPAHRRRGAGTGLLRHAAGRAAADGRTLLAAEALQGTPGEEFAKRMGARAGVLEARRVLDIAAIAPGRIAALRAEAAAAAAGYSLASWTGPVPPERLAGYARVREAMNDAPSDYEDERWDAQRVLETVNPRIERSALRRYTIIAVHEATGQTAAFTELDADPEVPGWGFQNNTGVARPHRGHRLGLLVKAAMLEWLAAAEPGLRQIMTWNAAANRHMIAINERLGFRELRPRVQEYEIRISAMPERPGPA
jgi:GNAT superfamily N-acetyltransferase